MLTAVPSHSGKISVLARHRLGTTGSTGHTSELILKLNMATIELLPGSVILRCDIQIKSLENLSSHKLKTTLSSSFMYSLFPTMFFIYLLNLISH